MRDDILNGAALLWGFDSINETSLLWGLDTNFRVLDAISDDYLTLQEVAKRAELPDWQTLRILLWWIRRRGVVRVKGCHATWYRQRRGVRETARH